jgi:UDP-4-amino-4,6-dideoxy-N-acetyl-beta-L-altrosamine transaminase
MKPSRTFLPYGRHVIEDDDKAAVMRVLESDWLTTGPAVAEFEAAFRSVLDVPHAVSCSNGTAALHLAALALGLGPGDTVVVPAMTFLATANAARYVGADVKFADVDPETGLLTPETLEAAIREAKGARLKAVFPVHLNGQCCDCAGIERIARANGLMIVEDACHALGTIYSTGHNEAFKAGACYHSDLATFSFHPVKTIAMGEGGAVTTRKPEMAARLEDLRNHGMTRDPQRFLHREQAFGADGTANPWYYEMPQVGFNYRVSDINCALGLSQLRKLERFAEARHVIAAEYDAAFRPYGSVLQPVRRVSNCQPSWHIYVLLIDFKALGRPRDGVMRELRERGVGTQVHYLPVNRQPYYRSVYGDIRLPGADAYYDRCLSIPYYASMTRDDARYVAETLVDVLEIGPSIGKLQ